MRSVPFLRLGTHWSRSETDFTGYHHALRQSHIVVLISLALAPCASPAPVVLNTCSYALGDSVGGNSIMIRKMADPTTGRRWIVSSDPAISDLADIDSIQAQKRKGEREKWGALQGSLRPWVVSAGPQDSVRINVTLRVPEVRYVDRRTVDEESARTTSRNISRLKPMVSTTVVAGRLGLTPDEPPDSATRSFRCFATPDKLRHAMHDPAIVSVEDAPDQLPLATTEPFYKLGLEALNPSAHPSDWGGAGIKTATFEGGLTPAYILQRPLNNPCYYPPQYPYFCMRPFETAVSSDHARQCFSCLYHTAPAAILHHINSLSYNSSYSELRILNFGLQTISMSIERKDQQQTPRDQNYSEFLCMDDWAYRWPYPLFCSPSGNDQQQAEAQWQNYNGISVGSAKKWQEQTWQFDGFTSARNPDPVYGFCLTYGPAPCAGDRELPHILAPGSHPYQPQSGGSQYLWTDYPSHSPDWNASGTSYSAPVLNGVAARVASSRPDLFSHNVDGLKLALLLTAQNVDGGHWMTWEDGLDGAGVVSTYDAIDYAVNCTDVWGYSGPTPPVVSGYTREVGGFGMTDKVFQVLIPQNKPQGKHLRVALVWLSNPDLNAGTNSISDLDLDNFIANGGAYYWSGSWDDNVEIIDVDAGQLTAGGVYSFTVHPWVIRIPSGARAQFFYYSVGWAWVKDHA